MLSWQRNARHTVRLAALDSGFGAERKTKSVRPDVSDQPKGTDSYRTVDFAASGVCRASGWPSHGLDGRLREFCGASLQNGAWLRAAGWLASRRNRRNQPTSSLHPIPGLTEAGRFACQPTAGLTNTGFRVTPMTSVLFVSCARQQKIISAACLL